MLDVTNFEVFRGKHGRVDMVGSPTFTISRQGHFTLNRMAYEQLGSPAAVELLYDRDSRIIGLRPAEPGNRHVYSVRPAGSDKWFRVSGCAFIRHYGITIGDGVTARRWVPVIANGVLCVDLNNPGVEVTRKRS